MKIFGKFENFCYTNPIKMNNVKYIYPLPKLRSQVFQKEISQISPHCFTPTIRNENVIR